VREVELGAAEACHKALPKALILCIKKKRDLTSSTTTQQPAHRTRRCRLLTTLLWSLSILSISSDHLEAAAAQY
jgi:hypothetical protein